MFNPSPSYWMHIDLNSCFATIEQQANPFLRGKPIAVAADTSERSTILAPSIEAKRFGVKTGMRVFEGKNLCPRLLILDSDPAKYRYVNKQFQALFSQYSPRVSVRSIDEMLLHFAGLPILKTKTMTKIGQEIKDRIKQEIGEWLTVSIGISTNPYLSKLAANIRKPDGLDEINQKNILAILSNFKLTDLPYIKEANSARLNRMGVWTPVDFYFASATKLKGAFESIVGDYWYLRLHGWPVDEVDWEQKSIGHSYHLQKFTDNPKTIKQYLCKLVEKMGRRIRKDGYVAYGIDVSCLFVDGSHWHKHHTFPTPMYASNDLFTAACHLLDTTFLKQVRILAVSSFALKKQLYNQLSLLHDEDRKRALSKALDTINNTWGEFTVVPGTIVNMNQVIRDRIAFGKPN